MRRHLVIFARSPRIGAAKRRLARDIGAVAAWRFYAAVLQRIVARLARDPRWECTLATTGGPNRWPCHVRRIAQGSGDLGARMHRVMRTQPAGPVVIIGADIPDIAPRHIAAAFAALGRNDAVFGPADDGGYWLIGLRRRPFLPRLDGLVRWSSEHALADTRRLFGPRVRTALLETLVDVDDGESLARWRRQRQPGLGYFS